jgi:hypothetical protein
MQIINQTQPRNPGGRLEIQQQISQDLEVATDPILSGSQIQLARSHMKKQPTGIVIPINNINFKRDEHESEYNPNRSARDNEDGTFLPQYSS